MRTVLHIQEEFLKEYVKKSRAVVLENCTAGWRAQQDWTVEGLMMEGGGNKPWVVDFNRTQLDIAEDEASTVLTVDDKVYISA